MDTEDPVSSSVHFVANTSRDVLHRVVESLDRIAIAVTCLSNVNGLIHYDKIPNGGVGRCLEYACNSLKDGSTVEFASLY